MRAALICLPQAGDDANPLIAGKSVVDRQLDFARIAGCELILAYGAGAGNLAVALRHAAESAGLRYMQITNAHSLAGAIGPADSLLVMQPDLLPLSKTAIGLLGGEAAILVLPAGAGCQAGFERIDLDRAWAGALIMPGDLLGRLVSLDEDVAPAAALLRIALQARLPEARLSDQAIDTGEWRLIANAEQAEAHQRRWLRGVLGDPSAGAISRRLGAFFLRLGRGRLAAERRLPLVAWPIFALLVAGGVAAAWFERDALGFAALALASIVAELLIAKARIDAAPFATTRFVALTRKAVDLALLVVSTLAIDSLWFREIFAGLMLIGGLWLLDQRTLPNWLEILRDRAVIAAILALAAALGQAEGAILIAASLFMLANIAPQLRTRG